MKTKLRWLREMWKDWWNNQYQMPLRCQKPLVSVSMTVNQGGSVLEKLQPYFIALQAWHAVRDRVKHVNVLRSSILVTQSKPTTFSAPHVVVVEALASPRAPSPVPGLSVGMIHWRRRLVEGWGTGKKEYTNEDQWRVGRGKLLVNVELAIVLIFWGCWNKFSPTGQLKTTEKSSHSCRGRKSECYQGWFLLKRKSVPVIFLASGGFPCLADTAV